jgi:Secretory lipase
MRRPRRKFVLVAVAAAAAVALLAVALPLGWSAGTKPAESADGSSNAPVPIQSAVLGGSGPGSLISAMTMPELSRTPDGRKLQAARVVYRSTEGDTEAPTVVSGSVFTPLGPAPSGGWPVVAFAHGTLGVDNPCGPSLYGSLLGNAYPVTQWIGQGYAVAFADYQGLGYDGIHPYPDARTAGRNVIDSVRALRETFKNVSNRWAAFGGSQGGGSSWAANEQAGSYAPELDLVGAVAISPAADMTGIVDKAQAGTLTSDQEAVWELMVKSLARLHPDLNPDDYRHGAAAQYWDILTACAGPLVHDRNAAAAQLVPQDFVPNTQEAADRLRGFLAAWALPQQKLAAPLSVAYTGADTFIDSDWVRSAITRACQLGGTVVWVFDPNKGHGDVDFDRQQHWMADRFAGKPVVNECP